MTLFATVTALVVGAAANVERKAFGPFLMARPLVVAPLLGAVAGHPTAGLLVGVPLELYFLASASYGAAPPPHETIAALFAGAFVSTSGEPSSALLACAVFASLPLSVVGRALEARLERSNVALVEQAEAALTRGAFGAAARQALRPLGWVAFAGAAATALGLLTGQATQRLLPLLPDGLRAGLTYAWPLFLGMSLAMAVRATRARGGWRLALAGLAVVLAGYGLVALF